MLTLERITGRKHTIRNSGLRFEGGGGRLKDGACSEKCSKIDESILRHCRRQKKSKVTLHWPALINAAECDFVTDSSSSARILMLPGSFKE